MHSLNIVLAEMSLFDFSFYVNYEIDNTFFFVKVLEIQIQDS